MSAAREGDPKMPIQIGTKPHDFNDPTELMSDCHRRVEMFLGTLNALADFEGKLLTDDERKSLDRALHYFREAAPKHSADEEESLFPRLRASSNPEVQSVLADMARLERDHNFAAPLHAEVDRLGLLWLRDGKLTPEYAQQLQSAVASLVAMYRAHIEFEDRMLFPLASRILSSSQKNEIAQEMAERRGLADRARVV
jgi:hemerythrin-like domain-containing protein